MDAAKLTDDQLEVTPFFSLDNGKNPGLSKLVGDAASASQFLKNMVSETDLTNYYSGNEGALDKISVRDWLLAEAFPATSFAMGRNVNNTIPRDRNNFDMSTTMKTDDSRWPKREEIEPDNREWRHSDYRNMAYQHVYNLFQAIMTIASEQNN